MVVVVLPAQTDPWYGAVLKVWSVKQAGYSLHGDGAVGEVSLPNPIVIYVPEDRISRSPSGMRSLKALFEDGCYWGLDTKVEGTNSASKAEP